MLHIKHSGHFSAFPFLSPKKQVTKSRKTVIRNKKAGPGTCFLQLCCCLLYELPDKPYYKAWAYDGEDYACYPASADSQNVADDAADETADYTEDKVLKDAAGIALHERVGDETADSSYYDLYDKFDKHVFTSV